MTSQPISVRTSSAMTVTQKGQAPFNAIQRPTAIMAAKANVLPRTIVASRSCASPSNRTTIDPAAGARWANCRACHLLREKSAVSATAKKKLIAANTKMTTTAAMGPIGIAAIMGENNYGVKIAKTSKGRIEIVTQPRRNSDLPGSETTGQSVRGQAQPRTCRNFADAALNRGVLDCACPLAL